MLIEKIVTENPMNSKIVSLQISMSKSLKQRLKVQALKEGITLRELTNRLLGEYLDEVEEREKKIEKTDRD